MTTLLLVLYAALTLGQCPGGVCATPQATPFLDVAAMVAPPYLPAQAAPRVAFIPPRWFRGPVFVPRPRVAVAYYAAAPLRFVRFRVARRLFGGYR